VWNNVEKAPISQLLKALLAIAAKVQKNAGSVSKHDVDFATAQGASEADVHDTVLIAAAFCMFNRYVDGLGTTAPPRESPTYAAMGERLAKNGYGRPT
jgi:alkylhydroperoxidase family enzyme